MDEALRINYAKFTHALVLRDDEAARRASLVRIGHFPPSESSQGPRRNFVLGFSHALVLRNDEAARRGVVVVVLVVAAAAAVAVVVSPSRRLQVVGACRNVVLGFTHALALYDNEAASWCSLSAV